MAAEDATFDGYSTEEGLNAEFANLSNLQMLQLQKRHIVERLAELTRSPKPSYDIDGQKFSWTEYQRFLTEQLRTLNGLIAEEDSPMEEESIGYL